MKRLRRLFKLTSFLVLLPVFFPQSIRAEIPEAMINAIGTGNSAVLASYFNLNLELAILENEDIYTKQQAELIMKDFFARNTPTSFTILHKGGKEGSQYAIGNLVTANGNFRVTILVKLKENKPLIHQLRFEKDGE
jgi:hypothetical protein